MASAGDIDSFISITGSSKADAVSWLKASNGNVESAIGAYYDSPTNPLAEQHDASQWDEGPFHSDKTVYGPQTQKQASFNVHSHDTLSPRVFDAMASRPPSRVSNRGLSPGPGGNSKPLSFLEQEEEEMNKAMAMSLNLPGQENGVTDAPRQHFGPARQTHYDANQWAMSISGPRAQEILQNPDPELRKRDPRRPVFLKPALGKHLLPPLLTILHAIPMTREAFLLREYTVSDYGQNSEWWDGNSIETPRVIVELDQSYDQDPNWDEILIEAQRIMAFLDHSDRAYGSAEPLANTGWLREREDPVNGFLELWRGTAARIPGKIELRDSFLWTVFTDGETKDYPVIDFADLSSSQSNPFYTIYDALDDSLWSAFRATDTDATQIERVPEVLIFRLQFVSLPTISHGIRVPPVWYADRYLKENANVARQMRLEKESFENEIRKLKEAQGRLTEFSSPIGTLNGNALLTLVKTHLEEDNSSDLEDECMSKLIDFDSADPASSDPSHKELTEEISDVVSRVTQKIEMLERSKTEALRQLHELSKLYTEPSEDPHEPPHHKYTLRGVSTDYRTTYVLRYSSGAYSDDLLISETPHDWQWWKITFTIGDANPISYSMVREVEVLKAAKDGGREVLIIYASDKAVSYSETALPSQLQAFVQTDNQAFATEFDRASSKPATPTKRKVDEAYDKDNSVNDPDVTTFPAYQPDLVSITSPSKKLNNGSAATATRDLSKWEVGPALSDSSFRNTPSESHQTVFTSSSSPRNELNTVNETSNSGTNSDPYTSNTSKLRAITTKNNPFLKTKPKPSSFDERTPVSFLAPSLQPESQASTHASEETVLLENDEDMVLHHVDSTGVTTHYPTLSNQSYEMQEKGGNLGVLRGATRGFNSYQSERQVPDLIMYDSSEERKGG